MRTPHAHPDPGRGIGLVFEPNRFEQAALETAYQYVVPRIQRATAAVTTPEFAAHTPREVRRKLA